ncbi:MAG: type II toxin-antitoxin system PemK/MazF family toxin [Clostridiales bacterium]|nr:type II toxin-antitoxin system PemK/MazF family toxin [Clostridiales bacterium]
MKRGDIYMARLDPVIGSEQGGRRPVLIVQNDRGNRYSPTVIVVPLTGSEKKGRLPTHVLLPGGEGGVQKPSVVLCEQVRTLEKTRLTRYMGSLSQEKLKEVEAALSVSLDMNSKGSA